VLGVADETQGVVGEAPHRLNVRNPRSDEGRRGVDEELDEPVAGLEGIEAIDFDAWHLRCGQCSVSFWGQRGINVSHEDLRVIEGWCGSPFDTGGPRLVSSRRADHNLCRNYS
jgi:hypothetical protein